jgi:uncharacterized protein
MKLLIWLVIVWAVVVWMQRTKKNVIRRAREAAAAAQQAGGTAQAAQPAGAASTAAIEQMVQCAQCGIHFPKSEAVQARGTGLVFCCPEHRELHALDAGIR